MLCRTIRPCPASRTTLSTRCVFGVPRVQLISIFDSSTTAIIFRRSLIVMLPRILLVSFIQTTTFLKAKSCDSNRNISSVRQRYKISFEDIRHQSLAERKAPDIILIILLIKVSLLVYLYQNVSNFVLLSSCHPVERHSSGTGYPRI